VAWWKPKTSGEKDSHLVALKLVMDHSHILSKTKRISEGSDTFSLSNSFWLREAVWLNLRLQTGLIY